MSRVTVITVPLMFKEPLSERPFTRFFAIHHIGHLPATLDPARIDADMINDWHRQRGWSGIGYHYVICTDGHIERGRPRKALGAHLKGSNSESIGICVAGDFSSPTSAPTAAQMDSLQGLLADLCEIYGLRPNDPWVILGHRDREDSECPGDGLYALLPAIRVAVAGLCGL